VIGWQFTTVLFLGHISKMFHSRILAPAELREPGSLFEANKIYTSTHRRIRGKRKIRKKSNGWIKER
jgi:hypothetical protein